MSLLRHALVLGATALVTWWLLFMAPAPVLAQAEPNADRPAMRAQLQPMAQEVASAAVENEAAPPQAEDAPPEPAEPEPAASEPAPMAPNPTETEPVAAAELGSRSGTEEAERREAPLEPAEATDAPRASAGDLARDSQLLLQAEKELGGAEVALGFTTTLISEPEQQLQIAKAFGEEIVLVPKAALLEDSEALSYRLRPARSSSMETLRGLPDLRRSRQHRDLFAYDLGRLPTEIRALRRNVIRRDEVFLFAALIPAAEWAIVIGRRREAVLAAGIDESNVERYVLRYVPTPRGGFDFLVEEIRLADGERLRRPFRSHH